MLSIDPLVIEGVIGDVVETVSQSIKMSVIYDSKKPYGFTNGQEFLPSQVADPPLVEVHEGEFRSFFTLIMTDPDAPGPSDPFLREHLHWIVTDIPGKTDSTYGKTIVSYEAPKPVKGIHRFVFLLYQQKGRGKVKPPQSSSRDNFRSRKFAEENEFGHPVAAVFFNCQRETAARKRLKVEPKAGKGESSSSS